MTGEILCSALRINPSFCLHYNQSVLNFLSDNQMTQATTQAFKHENHSMPSTQSSSQFQSFGKLATRCATMQISKSSKDAMCMPM